MKFIRSIQKIEPPKQNGTLIIYMHGYGGYLWEAKRHLNLLKRAGYQILAMDFRDVLKAHDPKDLVDLMDEVDKIIKDEGFVARNTIVVGVSLGGLVGFNLIKRHQELDKLIVITGGDMTHIPSSKSLKKNWRLTRDKLTEQWQDVNIYSEVGTYKDKHIVMLLPLRDKVIDPDEVTAEILKHSQLNDIKLIRTKGGHFRTIITQTVLRPKNSLSLLDELKKF